MTDVKKDASVEVPKTFDITGLSESELNFIVNALFNVEIKSKDAKLVSELQQRLIATLTATGEAEA